MGVYVGKKEKTTVHSRSKGPGEKRIPLTFAGAKNRKKQSYSLFIGSVSSPTTKDPFHRETHTTSIAADEASQFSHCLPHNSVHGSRLFSVLNLIRFLLH